MPISLSSLRIDSGGSIIAGNLTADANASGSADGVDLNNISGTGKVAVTCGSFLGNGTDAAGNYTPLEWTTDGGVTPAFAPRPCTLP